MSPTHPEDSDSPPPFERYRSIIPEFDQFLGALNRPLPTCVWANPNKTTPQQLERYFESHHIDYRPLGWVDGAYRLSNVSSPGTRFGFVAGLYHVQEEVSLLPVELMDLHPGQRILDACAAPGSKTTRIATTVGQEATVIANDRNFHRMAPLARSVDRLGITNTAVMVHDATNLPGHIGTFDRLLADVPCSCEATWRKNHEVGPADDADFQRLCTIQRAILARCLQLCRPGGRVVYSTCSFAPEENEAIVDTVLAEHGDHWDLVPTHIDGFKTSPGLVRWQDRRFDPRLQHAVRVYPHQNDTGGFFVAVLEHRGEPHD